MMTVNEMLLNLLYLILSLAISVGGAFLAKYIKTDTDLKNKDEIAEAVIAATACVQQTFVYEAKKTNKFDDDAQKQAMNMAINMTTELLSATAKNYLYRNRGESEVREYLATLIEESVRRMKKEDVV